MELHENKPNPGEGEATRIVQAFGLRACPKLVEQLSGEDLNVRVNVLAVLCEEFKNPYTIQGCARAGVVRVLATMVSDPDYVTRERSSRALALLAEDANGLSSILEDEDGAVVVEILNGIKDPSETVRSNVYDCILNITRTRRGVESCVIAGVASSFAEVAKREMDALKPKVLASLHNMANSADGMVQALNAGCVEICIGLLRDGDSSAPPRSGDSAETKSMAAKTLGLLCFDEEAKIAALEHQAIAALMGLCTGPHSTSTAVKTNATLALMAITSTDEGKRQLAGNSDWVKLLSNLVYDDCKAVRLHILKLLTNAAVYPPIRPFLLEDAPFMNFLKKLASAAAADKLVEKHAKLALEGINWSP